MSRVLHLLRGVGALALLVGLVVGIPWALWHFIGWPLPHHLPSSGQMGHALDQQGIADQTLIDALAVVVWVTWAVLVVSIIVELPAALAGRHAPRLPVAGIFQPLTGRLVAAVLVALLTLAPRPNDGTAPGSLGGRLSAASGRQPVAAMVVKDTAVENTALRDAGLPDTPFDRAVLTASTRALPSVAAPTVSTAGAVASNETSGPSRTYVVQRGDTLWGIAEQQLGDPLLWSEIYVLNEGRPQLGGTSLTDPHWIDPGWTLLLPAGPTVAPPAPAPVPDPAAPTPPTSPTTPSTAPAIAPTTTPVTTSSPSAGPTTSTSPARVPVQSKSEAHGTGTTATSIRLPSGSIVAGSFAAGVLSALAAGRLRRRRRYRPQPPHPGRHVKVEPQPAGLRDLLLAVRAKGKDQDQDLAVEVRSEPPPMTAIPDDDALLRPDVIEVALRGDEVIRLGICDWPGLALSGPGAASTLRAWLAALITRNGPYGAEMLVVGTLGERLLPGLELPGLHRLKTVEGALSRLESEMIARTRQLDADGLADVIVHRTMSPEYPLPLVLMVTDLVPESLQSRWLSMASSATRLGIAALILIPPHAPEESQDSQGRIVIDEDGSILRVTPPALADLLEGGLIFELSVSETVDLLGPVASIHNDHEFEEPELLYAQSESGFFYGSFPDNSFSDSSALEVGTAEGAAGGSPPSNEHDEPGALSWPARGDPEPEPAPIRVELLGPALVEAWGEKVSSGLRASAYELLAWYALRPEGATAEAAIEALWPDASAKRGRERFWTALGNLRSRLHGPGEDGVEILSKVGEHYRPDPSVLDIDLWRFEAALTESTRASGGVHMVAALERAAVAFGGEFYPSADALWVEPVREDLHRRALDVHIRLAELYDEADRPDAAVGALERAIELDSICEDAYRRLIVLLARLGRTDAAQRAWRLLLGHLAELDLEPEVTTADLVHDLLNPRPTPADRQARPPRA
jgi:DNA-binding SARP family transcriptional activator